MRLYTFTNMYLSSLQNGIQTAHVVSELFSKYATTNIEDSKRMEQIMEWADNHKTIIVLNGGYSDAIRELFHFMDNIENPYPFANFHEGEDALDGALTAVGIVLPEKIYDGRLVVFGENGMGEPLYNNPDNLTYWEIELVERLANFSLAR